jgi:hydrogenase-1 operon protein HyaF
MFEGLTVSKMPAGVASWHPPQVARDEDVALLTGAKDALLTLLDAAKAYAEGGPAVVVDISHLDAANLDVIDQILGQGEVQAVVGATRVQEAVMPGLWRLNSDAAQALEVADISGIVRAFANTLPATLDIPAALPEGSMNVGPVLVEIADAMTLVQPGSKEREINLTLLPMTPVDLNVLAETLGTGGLTILSRGYGNCRITACAARGVWRTSYFNSDDSMILDVVEVGDVPAAALAAREDVADAADRLEQVISAYWP